MRDTRLSPHRVGNDATFCALLAESRLLEVEHHAALLVLQHVVRGLMTQGLHHYFDPVGSRLLNVVDKFEDFCDFGDLRVLALHRREKFVDSSRQQFFYLLLQQSPHCDEKLFGLALLFLLFVDLVVLHEFDEVGKLELLFALVLENLAPLFKCVQKDLLSVEFISVEQRIDLRFLSKADVVKHGHALLLHPLDDALNLNVEFCIVIPHLVDSLD